MQKNSWGSGQTFAALTVEICKISAALFGYVVFSDGVRSCNSTLCDFEMLLR